jgi:DNA primase
MLQPSEEIKSRINVVDLIKEYVQLKPAGTNFRARCPFHQEKSPSFMVSPDKQIWHCFGCGRGGDIFGFVMEMEGLSFVETLRQLAVKAGVKLAKSDPQAASQRNRNLDILDLTAKYYNYMLAKSPKSGPAREYLAKRGLDEATIEEWRIGYSLDEWNALSNFLISRGYKENEIFSAGLSVKREGRSEYYDRFRGRIMFPISDIGGNVVAFTARVSPERESTEKMGKYINSPQTSVYDKSRVLFGLDKARLEIKKADLAIIVEGQMDAITAHQFGYKNVVASSGTALTEEQINLIKRYTQNISIAFDSDAAGEMAAERGGGQAMKADMNIKVIEVPNQKDPDDCIRQNKELWEKAVREAKPIMQYYFERKTADLDLTDIEGKRQAAKRFLPIIARLDNKIDMNYWLKSLGEKIDINEHVLRETLQTAIDSRKKDQGYYKPIKKTEPSQAIQSREERLSEMLLAMMLKFNELIYYLAERVPIDHLAGVFNQELYRNLIIYYNSINNNNFFGSDNISNDSSFEINNFINWANESNINIKDISRLIIVGERDFNDIEYENIKNEAIKITAHLKKKYIFARMKEIEKLLAIYEKENKSEELKEIMQEFKNLSEETKSMENMP